MNGLSQAEISESADTFKSGPLCPLGLPLQSDLRVVVPQGGSAPLGLHASQSNSCDLCMEQDVDITEDHGRSIRSLRSSICIQASLAGRCYTAIEVVKRRGTASDQQLDIEDYWDLPDDGRRHEILEGMLEVTPSPLVEHQDVLKNLLVLLELFLRQCPVGKIIPSPMDVILSNETICQPDLVFIRKERVPEIVRGRVWGTPDLVIEILSSGTANRDYETKKHVYARHRIGEYWSVDPKVFAESTDTELAVYQVAELSHGGLLSKARGCGCIPILVSREVCREWCCGATSGDPVPQRTLLESTAKRFRSVRRARRTASYQTQSTGRRKPTGKSLGGESPLGAQMTGTPSRTATAAARSGVGKKP